MVVNRKSLKSEDAFALWQQLLADRDALHNAFRNHVTVHGGLAVGTTTTTFKLGQTSYLLAGLNYTKAAADNIAAPASTTSGQFRKDLISIDAAGTVTVTAGTPAASQGAAVKPALPANQLELGWIEVPNSFTSGSTNVTGGMLKPVIHGLTFGLVVG